MRRFFGSLVSTDSLSLASRFDPATLPATLDPPPLGVSGGVVRGTPPTLPELVAAMLGMFPEINVGLLTTPVGTEEDCVAIDDVELDLVGEAGRRSKVADGGGEGAANELVEFR